MIRIDSGDETTALTPTSIAEQEFREDDLREWILDDQQSILGEKVRIIGHEVAIKDIGDAIDLIAIDRDGNVVIIELKQGRITGNVDFQSLKYAAYTSHWNYEQLRDQFEGFKSTGWGESLYEEETTFTELLDEFCNDDYELNQDQRLVLVGESLAKRLDLVARWLSDRNIDISVIEVQLYEDDGRVYLDSEQTIPVPNQTASEVSPDTSEEPWKSDGRSWHVHEVSNDETAELLEEVVAALEEIELLDGPHWQQKEYVSFKQDRKNRVIARTRTTLFNIEIYDVPAEDVDIEKIAESLDVPIEDVQAEEETLPGARSGVRITCKGGQDIKVGALADETQNLLTGNE